MVDARKLLFFGTMSLFLPGTFVQATQANSVNATPFIGLSGASRPASQIIGLEVYNQSNQKIGQIVDIAIGEAGKMRAYVLSTPHWLTPHYVAVDPSVLKIGTWHAQMNATLDQLKAAPQYRYSGQIAAKACLNVLRD